MTQRQKFDVDNSSDHAGKESGHGDASPVEAQHHTRKEFLALFPGQSSEKLTP